MYDELLGKLHFALFFIGFNAVYMSMFLAWETPRRVLNTTQRSRPITSSEPSGRSSSVLLFIMFYNLAKSYVSGPKPATTRGTTRRGPPSGPSSSPPPLENWPNRPSYASGKLEFMKDYVPEGGPAVRTDGDGNVATDGGDSHLSTLRSTRTGTSTRATRASGRSASR